MSDWATLARRLRESRDRGASVALATVVATEGSAYRRPGAWMIVLPGGQREGLVSGGCLESDVAVRAATALARGGADLATYDTRDSDDLVWGLGMGCQGVVRILIEPLSGTRLSEVAALLSRLDDVAEPAVLATVVGPVNSQRLGDRFLMTGEGGFATAQEAFPPEAIRRARERLFGSGEREALNTSETGPGIETLGGFDVAFTLVLPRIRLVVCGAGEDAIPLTALAAELDWSVFVADQRPAAVRPERFPRARVELLPNASELASRIGPVGPRTAAVVMSHNIARDIEWTAALLPLPIGYLGLLGPRRRGEQILRTAGSLAVQPVRATRILYPAGLDIASETPREIAVAIVAEISAVVSGRAGGFLSERSGGIHDSSVRSSVPKHRF